MWGSVIGGLIGALVGAGTSYFVQRKLEAVRRHEEALKEMWHMSDELYNRCLRLLRGSYNDESLNNIHEIATEMELIAVKLDDEDLKKAILHTLNGPYDNTLEFGVGMMNLHHQISARAFPTLYDIKQQKPDDLLKSLHDVDDTDPVVYGPASDSFTRNDWEDHFRDMRFGELDSDAVPDYVVEFPKTSSSWFRRFLFDR